MVQLHHAGALGTARSSETEPVRRSGRSVLDQGRVEANKSFVVPRGRAPPDQGVTVETTEVSVEAQASFQPRAAQSPAPGSERERHEQHREQGQRSEFLPEVSDRHTLEHRQL